MNRKSSETYVQEALSALAKCKTDNALNKWEDNYTSSKTYLELPNDLVVKLEGAFNRRFRWVMGEDAVEPKDDAP